MHSFDKEKYKNYLVKEFNSLDKHYVRLSKILIEDINIVIAKHFPLFKANHKAVEYIKLFATYLINSTESIIDKDKNYPDYRLAQELRFMKKIAGKETKHSINKIFEQDLLYTLKSFLVKHFDKIFDLSGDGFRLIDVNTTIYILYFLHDFYFDDYFNA